MQISLIKYLIMTETINVPVTQLKKLVSGIGLLPFNRKISDKHVEKMRNSLMSCGMLRLPVLGELEYENNTLAIIDGQHLITALTQIPRYRGKKITCMVRKYKNKAEVIRDIAKLNNTQKAWKDEDYLDAWYQYGVDNQKYYPYYNEMHRLYNKTSISCGLAIDIFTSQNVGKQEFKNGRLTFFDPVFSRRLLFLADNLKNKHNLAAFALQGLRKWSFKMHKSEKGLDFDRLETALEHSIKNKKHENANYKSREGFENFVNESYNSIKNG